MPVDFPTNALADDTVLAHNKIWQFDGVNKWELLPLIDEFDNVLPVVLEQDSVEGVGRNFEHSFTIKDLLDLETYRATSIQE